MAFSDLTLVKYKDRVRDFTLSTAAPFVLEEEPPIRYQGFGDALADGERCHYVVLDSNGTWALYRGAFSATGVSLSAITFLDGSATAPSWTSERKEIFLVAAGVSYEDIIAEIVAISALTPAAIPVSIAEGGTSATSATGARTALGLAIGSDVQAWDVVLDGFAALTTASHVPYFSAASTVSSFPSEAYGRALLNVATEAALKALINAEAGVDFQAWDVVLDGFAALSAASQIPFFSAASTVGSFGSQAYGRTLLDVANEAAFKALINAEAGVDFQAWDVVLDGFAALTTASHVPYFSGASTVSSFPTEAFGRSRVNVANAGAGRVLDGFAAALDDLWTAVGRTQAFQAIGRFPINNYTSATGAVVALTATFLNTIADFNPASGSTQSINFFDLASASNGQIFAIRNNEPAGDVTITLAASNTYMGATGPVNICGDECVPFYADAPSLTDWKRLFARPGLRQIGLLFGTGSFSTTATSFTNVTGFTVTLGELLHNIVSREQVTFFVTLGSSAAGDIIALTLNDGTSDVHQPGTNGLATAQIPDSLGTPGNYRIRVPIHFIQSGVRSNTTPKVWQLRVMRLSGSGTVWVARAAAMGTPDETSAHVVEWAI